MRIIYLLKNYVYLVLLIFIFISCGYTETEDDKFPDMPVFPEHSNPEVSIEPLTRTIDVLYDYDEQNFIASIKYLYKESRSRMYVVKMDHTLKVLDSIETDDLFEMVKDGSFYIKNDKGKILKYSSFDAKPLVIEEHPFNGITYKERVEKELREGKYARGTYPDSLSSKIWEIVDSISYHKSFQEFDKQQLTGLQCVIDFYSESKRVLVYEDEEYLSSPQPSSNDYGITANSILYDFKACEVKTKSNAVENEGLTITDKVVRANGSSGGNHFVPGSFYPIGLQYYELEIEGVKTQFKIMADPIGERQLFLRHILDSDIYLIDVVDAIQWNVREPTYIVNIK